VLRLEPLCLKQLSTLVVDSLRTVADEKHISIDLRAPDDLPPVRGDHDKVEQILWNLIGNAVKFTPAQGTVTVTAERAHDGLVQVCVADTGCGIAPEHLPRIFNEFSKVPSAMATAQGAQLGLYITKSLVTMHRGRIWIESAQGAGTQVRFTLPIMTDGEALHSAEPERPGCPA
jgi:two-component system, sensor histidine kinase and response regulator